jgi:DNA-binding SARP family transcriptional activator
MRFRVLGPLDIIDSDGRPITDEYGRPPIRAKKIQTLLLVLLVNSNRTVPCDQLIDEIWGEAPPPRANAALQVYVSQLRKFLKQDNLVHSLAIVTKPPGYQLQHQTSLMDVDDFETMIDDGREQLRANRPETAIASLQGALDLWHAPAMSESAKGPIIGGFQRRLEESRLECIEMLAEARLTLGHHRQIIGWLTSIVASHPLHEVFHGQLMVALHRSGRRAEALQAYQSARETLRRELGLEPCHALQMIQLSVLQAQDEFANTLV